MSRLGQPDLAEIALEVIREEPLAAVIDDRDRAPLCAYLR
jgi:hypothetical protein